MIRCRAPSYHVCNIIAALVAFTLSSFGPRGCSISTWPCWVTRTASGKKWFRTDSSRRTLKSASRGTRSALPKSLLLRNCPSHIFQTTTITLMALNPPSRGVSSGSYSLPSHTLADSATTAVTFPIHPNVATDTSHERPFSPRALQKLCHRKSQVCFMCRSLLMSEL